MRAAEEAGAHALVRQMGRREKGGRGAVHKHDVAVCGTAQRNTPRQTQADSHAFVIQGHRRMAPAVHFVQRPQRAGEKDTAKYICHFVSVCVFFSVKK
jgi:hypothetical protein